MKVMEDLAMSFRWLLFCSMICVGGGCAVREETKPAPVSAPQPRTIWLGASLGITDSTMAELGLAWRDGARVVTWRELNRDRRPVNSGTDAETEAKGEGSGGL